MKIVHISMADFNGAGLCAYRICKAQRAMGTQVQHRTAIPSTGVA